jgi:hypothetical protein
MDTLDDYLNSFGQDALNRSPDRQPGHVWNELCQCGHLDRYHAPSIGGLFRLKEPYLKHAAGQEFTVTTMLTGCVGALKPRGFEMLTKSMDREARTGTDLLNPTCPCTDFRAVAKVDRPNRYFNQRVPADRADPRRHPFHVGIRAFTTHLSKRRAALSDPSWPRAEFNRRFLWLDGKRVCGLSKCRTDGDGVWPQFVRNDGLSEMRCPAHR